MEGFFFFQKKYIELSAEKYLHSVLPKMLAGVILATQVFSCGKPEPEKKSECASLLLWL